MTFLRKLAEDGFALVPGVFTSIQVEDMLGELKKALQEQPEAIAIRSNAGGVYAARNVLALWPEVAAVWRQPPLPDLLASLLGPNAGLVRGLFFDKPPERTWALPW